MAALGEQLAQLSIKQIQKLPVDERLIDALMEVQNISSFEARRRQFQRIGKLLRNEDETVILSYLTPQQGAKKQAQLMRWVDRMIEQGDPAINEFSKIYNASERHTLRQHVLRIKRDKTQEVSEAELEHQKVNLLTMCSKLPYCLIKANCSSIVKSDAQGVAFLFIHFQLFLLPIHAR